MRLQTQKYTIINLYNNLNIYIIIIKFMQSKKSKLIFIKFNMCAYPRVMVIVGEKMKRKENHRTN